MTRLPGTVEEIRYGPRSDGRYYKHQFRPGVRHLELTRGTHRISLPHGGVLLYSPKRQITADDRAPGFDRYRRREENMARKKTWIWWLLGGVAVWAMMSRHAASTVTAATPTGGGTAVTPADTSVNPGNLNIFG